VLTQSRKGAPSLRIPPKARPRWGGGGRLLKNDKQPPLIEGEGKKGEIPREKRHPSLPGDRAEQTRINEEETNTENKRDTSRGRGGHLATIQQKEARGKLILLRKGAVTGNVLVCLLYRSVLKVE